jgi:hypothetical protein
MRKGFLIYEEMRKYLVVYEETNSHICLYNSSLLDFLIYEEFFFLLYQCTRIGIWENSYKIAEERMLYPFSF